MTTDDHACPLRQHDTLERLCGPWSQGVATRKQTSQRRSLDEPDTACNNLDMPAKRKTYDSMTEALLEAIADSELSYKRLERETGVSRQSLMKFAAHEQTIRLDAADKLAEFFGIEVTTRKAK